MSHGPTGLEGTEERGRKQEVTTEGVLRIQSKPLPGLNYSRYCRGDTDQWVQTHVIHAAR